MLTNPNPNPSPQPDSSVSMARHLKSSPVLKPQPDPGGRDFPSYVIPNTEGRMNGPPSPRNVDDATRGVEWGACPVPIIELPPYSLARHYPLALRCNARILANTQCIPPS
ncbi:hypothetical protein H920_06234 [Fukomys damarensis]|uniref:Uncharacterized protein n=1 Tax=Fukomys damarensis TaxID=885580 RepID=A0A091DPH2_FUKDA|nr:hypothetical protein H920_06234 [Fukomys damarensis]